MMVPLTKGLDSTKHGHGSDEGTMSVDGLTEALHNTKLINRHSDKKSTNHWLELYSIDEGV